MQRSAWLGASMILATVGCSRESPAPPPPAPPASAQVAAPMTAAPLTLEQALARAQHIDAQRAGWRSVPGTLQEGAASARFVTFYDAGVARLIEERLDAGTARYYLDTTARLFLFEARAEAGAPPEVEELRLVFEPDGRMVASQKRIGGRLHAVDKDEIDAVVRRLELLRAATPRG